MSNNPWAYILHQSVFVRNSKFHNISVLTKSQARGSETHKSLFSSSALLFFPHLGHDITVTPTHILVLAWDPLTPKSPYPHQSKICFLSDSRLFLYHTHLVILAKLVRMPIKLHFPNHQALQGEMGTWNPPACARQVAISTFLKRISPLMSALAQEASDL